MIGMPTTAKRTVARRVNPRRAPAPVIHRPKQDLVNLVLLDVPRDVKRALVRETARQRSNMTDVAVAKLAERFKVPFLPSGRKPPTAIGESGKVSLSMPRSLRTMIKIEAASRNESMQSFVVDILRESFVTKRKKVAK